MPLVPVNIMPRLDGAKIIIPVRVKVGDMAYDAKAMLDSGAQPTAVLGKSFARRIGVTASGTIDAIAVGGGIVRAQTAYVDGIEVPSSGCGVGREEVMITDLPSGDHDLIIGIAFIRDTGMNVTAVGRSSYVQCAGGTPVKEHKSSMLVPVLVAVGLIGIGYFLTR